MKLENLGMSTAISALSSSALEEDKRLAKALELLDKRFKIRNLPDLTEKFRPEQLLTEVQSPETLQHLISFLGDNNLKLKPSLEVPAEAVLSMIPNTALRDRVSSFIETEGIKQVAEFGEISFMKALAMGISESAALALNKVLIGEFKTNFGAAIGINSTPSPQPTLQPPAEGSLVSPSSLVAKLDSQVTSSPSDPKLLERLKFVSSGAVIAHLDESQRGKVYNFISRMRIQSLYDLLRTPPRQMADFGIPKQTILETYRAIRANFLNPRAEKEAFRPAAPKNLEEAIVVTKEDERNYPETEIRGYSVERVDVRIIIVNGERIEVGAKGNADLVLQTFSMHSQGKKIEEIVKALGWSSKQNVRLWLRRARVYPEPRVGNYQDGVAMLDAVKDIVREEYLIRKDSGAHPSPPENPLSNMPFPGSLSYRLKEKS